MSLNQQDFAVIDNFVEKRARAIAEQVYDTKGTQYGVPKVPVHIHNGSDAPLISFPNLINNTPYIALAQITIQPAQVLTMHTSPVTLIGQVPNNYIVVESIDFKLDYQSVAYVGTGDMEFRYTDASGQQVTFSTLSHTQLNATSTTYIHFNPPETSFTPVANSPIIADVATADPTSGNSPLRFIIKYRVVPI